jgi:hypothetical protein
MRRAAAPAAPRRLNTSALAASNSRRASLRRLTSCVSVCVSVCVSMYACMSVCVCVSLYWKQVSVSLCVSQASQFSALGL